MPEVRVLYDPARSDGDREALNSSCLSGMGKQGKALQNTFLHWEAAALSPILASGN